MNPEDILLYNEYKELCDKLEIEPLTLEQFNSETNLDVLNEHKDVIEKKALQLGNPNWINQGFQKIWNNPNFRRGAAETALNIGKDVIRSIAWNKAAQTAGEAVIDYASNKAEDFINRRGGNGGGGGFNSNNPSDFNSNHSPNYAYNNLNYKHNPLEIKLDTGIKNRVYSDTTQRPTPNQDVMHMNAIDISFTNFINNPNVNDYFNKVFYLELVSYAQAKVNFAIAGQTAMSASTIRTYFDAVIDAVNVYLYFMSIINYCDNPENNNFAMLDLRNRFTPEMFNYFLMLQRQLTTYPIPPKLMNFLYYLNGNFKMTSLDDSAIIKFETARLDLPSLQAVVNNLQTYYATASLLSRIFPEWLYRDLPTYAGVGFHDPNFTTIWLNAPYTYTATSGTTSNTYNGPFIQSETGTTIPYQTVCNNLDGASFALISIATPTNAFSPGMVTPVNSFVSPGTKSSRVSFTYNGWANSPDSTRSAISRHDTYVVQLIGTTANCDIRTIVGADAGEVQLVGYDTIYQAHYDFLEFMIDFKSMFERSDARPESKPKSNRSRRRK